MGWPGTGLRPLILHNSLKFQGLDASPGMNTWGKAQALWHPALLPGLLRIKGEAEAQRGGSALLPQVVEADLLFQHLFATGQELRDVAEQKIH